jgi:hypothetical protein
MTSEFGSLTAEEEQEEEEGETTLLDKVPPETLLGAASLDLMEPALEMEDDPEILVQYLEHERANKDRDPIKKAIRERIEDTADEGTAPLDVQPEGAPSQPDGDDESADGAGEPPAAETLLETDDVGSIRDTLREIEDPATLQEYRDYELDNQARQPVLDAIDLLLETIS